MKSLSHIQLFATPWTVAYKAPQSILSRQEYWSGLPFPSRRDHSRDLINMWGWIMISQVPSSLGPGPGSRPEGPGEAQAALPAVDGLYNREMEAGGAPAWFVKSSPSPPCTWWRESEDTGGDGRCWETENIQVCRAPGRRCGHCGFPVLPGPTPTGGMLGFCARRLAQATAGQTQLSLPGGGELYKQEDAAAAQMLMCFDKCWILKSSEVSFS